ncbi:hypothetical protein [Streptomyces albipurpureus]|uniref:Transcriptional regulator n=1 Tax=Streptomyces albipurpureus TaxID=2897419 RepID=A0ABT0UP47_9ACTN|nr:hypothetical protein [Streptomyces sp. CWNU-1]MCM2390210.1 hypothetical protein [Streptomyces sp. CWNU-1]
MLWPVVRSQLDVVTRLIPSASGQTADELMLLAAEHAHWLSWVAAQNQQTGPALAWLDGAHGWAIDASHADMASWLQRVRAYYCRQHSDPIRALRVADGARQLAGLSPGATSVAAHEASLAAAAVGERDRALRLADDAVVEASRVPDEPDRPAWLYWLTPSRARLHRADTAYACHRWQEAATGFEESLPGLAGFPRDQAHYQGLLTDAQRRAA